MTAEERLAVALQALRTIRDDEGKVCETFEICTHVACSSSYSAYAVADQALHRLEGCRH